MKRQYPTLAEVAKVAGVSLMTASRAINNRPGVSPEKREDILRIADEMGYVANRAAQKLTGARTRISVANSAWDRVCTASAFATRSRTCAGSGSPTASSSRTISASST